MTAEQGFSSLTILQSSFMIMLRSFSWLFLLDFPSFLPMIHLPHRKGFHVFDTKG
jgi:hypothetical protein